MKERGMLFSKPMVLALLNGSKTQTRRIVKPQPPDWVGAYNGSDGLRHFFCEFARDDDMMRHWPAYDEGMKSPYGQPGDLIWVRETFALMGDRQSSACWYRADREMPQVKKWTPSIHMPRWVSRIDLEITGVRVERLQDISDADCLAEGIDRMKIGHMPFYRNYLLSDEDAQVSPMFEYPLESYRSLWESINGAGSWDVNSWVWVVDFKRIKP